MISAFRARETFGLRLIAAILLGSIVGLTCGPVCGGPLDIDPGRCCERHRCAESGVSTSMAAKRGDCCHSSPHGLGANQGAEECCKRGRLTYPTAKVQPSCSSLAVAANALGILPAATFVVAAADGSDGALAINGSPPRTRAIPLYTLNSAYRI